MRHLLGWILRLAISASMLWLSICFILPIGKLRYGLIATLVPIFFYWAGWAFLSHEDNYKPEFRDDIKFSLLALIPPIFITLIFLLGYIGIKALAQ